MEELEIRDRIICGKYWGPLKAENNLEDAMKKNSSHILKKRSLDQTMLIGRVLNYFRKIKLDCTWLNMNELIITGEDVNYSTSLRKKLNNVKRVRGKTKED